MQNNLSVKTIDLYSYTATKFRKSESDWLIEFWREKETINSGRGCLDIIYVFVINEDGRKYQEQDSEETEDQIHLLTV